MISERLLYQNNVRNVFLPRFVRSISAAVNVDTANTNALELIDLAQRWFKISTLRAIGSVNTSFTIPLLLHLDPLLTWFCDHTTVN